MGFRCKGYLLGKNSLTNLTNVKNAFLKDRQTHTSSIKNHFDIVLLENPLEIPEIIKNDIWPIFFISDKIGDPLPLFESVFRIPGNELLSYLFIISNNEHKFFRLSKNISSKGYVNLPLDSVKKEVFYNKILPKEDESGTLTAMIAYKNIQAQQYEVAHSYLLKLSNNPKFQVQAMVSLARCEAAMGRFIQAEKRLKPMFEVNPNDVRAKLELADIYKRTNKIHEVLECYRDVIKFDEFLTLRIWEHISIAMEMDLFDEASELFNLLLERNDSKESALFGLCRLLVFFNVTDLAKYFLRNNESIFIEFMKMHEKLKATK